MHHITTVYSLVQTQATPLILACRPMTLHVYLLFFLSLTRECDTLVQQFIGLTRLAMAQMKIWGCGWLNHQCCQIIHLIIVSSIQTPFTMLHT
ncbi:hypothetical protein ID866_13117 [Astraeus odoratus]|nr:hypothetical protein ID866_13117 [Astraeus odoratus]